MKYTHLLVLLFLLLLVACGSAVSPAQTNQVTPALVQPEPTWPAADTPTVVFTPTTTPHPLWEYSVEHLRMRTYGGSLEVTGTLGRNSAFTRQLFHYDSDGLRIHGFANLPHGQGPFPVVIALHGYIEPEVYQTLDYTTHYADALASAGYLVLHPNLRGYPPSDAGDNLFRVGMAIDVLNLIAIVKEGSGQPGLLETADAERIGLWGHSMGGGVSLRVLTVSPDVGAAVLYAPMTGDERVNYEAIYRWSNNTSGERELAASDKALTEISPVNFFDEIQAAVSLHHGLDDRLVPVQWSMGTCEGLKSLGVHVECHYYESMPHTFYGPVEKQFMAYTLLFFDTYLATP
jgi:dipeptidyl aminopeptidase/acylaminoacyl peptidase